MLGTIVNTAAIAAGGVLGAYVIPSVPERVHRTVMHGLSLGILLIGLRMAWKGPDLLSLLIALAIGAVIGEWINIDYWFNRLGRWLERQVKSTKGDIGKGFVQATLIYCVGAMAIQGALQDGLQGDPQTLFAKSILDGVSAVMFSSALGIGVAFSAVPVFLYQGSITAAASLISGFLTQTMLDQMEAVGGLLVMAIGLNLLELTEIRIANLLPAIPLVALLAALSLF